MRAVAKGGIALAALLGLVLAVRTAHRMPSPPRTVPDDAAAGSRRPLPRPVVERGELAVLVRPDATGLDALTDVRTVAARLDVAQCGSTCDVLRGFVADPKRFELERTTADDYMLPPEDTWPVVARELSAEERAHLRERTVVLVVRAHEERREEATPPRHLPVRATHAVANLLVDALSGVVYDETRRTIEPNARRVTVHLDVPAFSPSDIVVQSYAEPDGGMRLVTLGMAAYGSPDLTVRAVPPPLEPTAAHLLNAVAAKIARGERHLPLTVTPLDVERGSGEADAGAPPLTLDAFIPDRTAGDPDNVLLELLPPGGESAASWTAALESLFGETSRVVHADQDDRLQAIARRARETFPSARDAVAHDAGALFVKGPFAYDGGSEWMWIAPRRCDAAGCVGPLTNDPTTARSWTKGDDAGVRLSDMADWMLVLPDGGTLGGASIEELEGRR